ncbi:MAG: guanylate kinase [Pseudomonadota bacterium]
MSGQVFIISAPSGAGKTSLVHAVLEHIPTLKVSVSYTTRAPRPGEEEGIAYHFVSVDHFHQMREHGDFIECAEVHGNFYGTSHRWIKEQLALGNDIILEIDWQGAEQVMRLLPDSSTRIFILPPSFEVLRERLTLRGQDHSDIINRRLRAAYEEVLHAPNFDYLVINEHFEEALQNLIAILRATRLKTTHVLNTKHEMLNALQYSLKNSHDLYN